jgi:hypothetical protein
MHALRPYIHECTRLSLRAQTGFRASSQKKGRPETATRKKRKESRMRAWSSQVAFAFVSIFPFKSFRRLVVFVVVGRLTLLACRLLATQSFAVSLRSSCLFVRMYVCFTGAPPHTQSSLRLTPTHHILHIHTHTVNHPTTPPPPNVPGPSPNPLLPLPPSSPAPRTPNLHSLSPASPQGTRGGAATSASCTPCTTCTCAWTAPPSAL